VDGEQISINLRAVFSRDSQPVLRPRKIARRASVTLGMRFKPPAHLAVRLAG